MDIQVKSLIVILCIASCGCSLFSPLPAAESIGKAALRSAVPLLRDFVVDTGLQASGDVRVRSTVLATAVDVPAGTFGWRVEGHWRTVPIFALCGGDGCEDTSPTDARSRYVWYDWGAGDGLLKVRPTTKQVVEALHAGGQYPPPIAPTSTVGIGLDEPGTITIRLPVDATPNTVSNP